MTTYAEAPSGWDRRRLVYGDWTWLIRDGLDVLRGAFIAGTIVFAVQGRSTAVALTAASSVLLVARVVDLPRWFDFGLIAAMSLIAWGTALSLYGSWFYYDKIVHGLSPVGYVPVLYIALVRLGVVPDPGRAIREHRVARISGIFIVTLAVGMAVGAGYETMITCDPSTSVIDAPARSAIERVRSAPAALSAVATTAHDGRSFHAGGPDASVNASSATGRWVAAITAVTSEGTSAAKASRNPAGSIANSTACPPLAAG